MQQGIRIKLNHYRRKKKLTMEELGELAGMSKQQISAYEAGIMNPTIKSLRKLAFALDIPLTKLFFDHESSKAPTYPTNNPEKPVKVPRRGNRRKEVVRDE